MIIISDSTPIISLIKINKLSLLKEMYDEIMIPQKVYDEIVCNKKFQQEKEVFEKAINDYIVVKNENINEYIEKIKKNSTLDAGEIEAISLAQFYNADRLLIDERKGRNYARLVGLEITGTLGLLKAAFCAKMLDYDEVNRCLDSINESSLFYGQSLLNTIRCEIEKLHMSEKKEKK